MSRARTLAALLGLAGLMSLGGCPSTDPRLSNQGGGSIVSAGSKVASGKISSLTPDEVQILTDAAEQADPGALSTQVDDAQAQAAVDFLKANNLNTVEQIQAFVAQAEANPASVVIPPSVLSLIASGDIPEVNGINN